MNVIPGFAFVSIASLFLMLGTTQHNYLFNILAILCYFAALCFFMAGRK